MDYRVVKVVDLLFVQCIEIFRIVVIIEFVFGLFFAVSYNLYSAVVT